MISIHALHEESDKQFAEDYAGYPQISIHALHEESDPDHGQYCLRYHAHFNPRSP